MKKLLYLFSLLFILITQKTDAQIFNGYVSSNFAGIQALQINPANAADSRIKFEFNLVAFDFGLYNNYLGILKKPVLDRSIFKADGANFQNIYMTYDSTHNTVKKNLNLNLDLNLPSFFFSLTNKIGIGFNWRVRTIFNANEVSPELAKLSYYGLAYPPLWKQGLNDNDIRVSAMSWAQYGVTFGDVVYDKGKHFVKAGITLNLLQGLGAAYLYADNLNYSFNNDTSLNINKSNLEYGHSTNFELDASNAKYKFIANPSIGADLGVIYEYRPKIDKYRYDMDGQKGLVRKDKDKYLVKVGVSLIDIGHVKYVRGDLSHRFTADTANMDIKHFQVNSIAQFDTILSTGGFRLAKTDGEKFTVALPTTLSAQIDYNVGYGLYVNFSPNVTLKKAYVKNQTRYVTRYDLTPRWDFAWLGIATPISYTEYKDLDLGVNLRLGPIIIGSNNIGTLLWAKYITNLNLYAAVKVQIPYGKPPRDRDHDGISDKKDHCPDVPGTFEFSGCPDKDGDHIPDDIDQCPDQAGTKEMHGCPDKDGDGIIDKEDKCPDVPGSKEYAGCPDTDGDGIPDYADSCKFVKGVKLFHGCPDTDGDGIPDKEDKCPDKAGLQIHQGCPDTDGDGLTDDVDHCPLVAGPVENQGCPYGDLDKDGVADKDDLCPDVAGPKENKGCPWSDRDKDGVWDKDDNCPDVAGPASNHGCPIIVKKDSVVLQKAFSNLLFQSASAIIAPVSYPSLDTLASLMKAHPDWTLKLSGYTDNDGDHDANVLLSKDRANAVKDYLVSKGVNAARLTTEWFGPDKPIGDNNTPEGRAKNRRVEMKLNEK